MLCWIVKKTTIIMRNARDDRSSTTSSSLTLSLGLALSCCAVLVPGGAMREVRPAACCARCRRGAGWCYDGGARARQRPRRRRGLQARRAEAEVGTSTDRWVKV